MLLILAITIIIVVVVDIRFRVDQALGKSLVIMNDYLVEVHSLEIMVVQ